MATLKVPAILRVVSFTVYILFIMFDHPASLLMSKIEAELFWRSVITRWLDRAGFTRADPARTSCRTFIITATLFVIGHSLWLAGIAYNWLYKKYRNLGTPVMAHAISNGMLGLWIPHTSKWRYR